MDSYARHAALAEAKAWAESSICIECQPGRKTMNEPGETAGQSSRRTFLKGIFSGSATAALANPVPSGTSSDWGRTPGCLQQELGGAGQDDSQALRVRPFVGVQVGAV